MEKILASLITIGDELLIGQVVDTNSAWIARQLNDAGIWVQRRVAVGDDAEAIRLALDQEGALSKIILITGGLGPTADDITKPVLAEYFGGRLVIDQATQDHVRYLFEKVFRRPGPMLERNLKQAEVPDVCTVLFNRIGTAPGMWFEKEGKVYVSMPGVPIEMKGLMQEEVLPRLRTRFATPRIEHRTVFTIGAGESMIAERLVDFEATLPPEIKLAYLPHYGMVRLRLTATNMELDAQFATLCALVRDITVVAEDMSMEAFVGKLLSERGKTLATAESATGGNLAHLVTGVPGSSHWYMGSIVSYDTSVKESLLGVPHDLIKSAGVVSEAVVTHMVKGLLERIGADYGLATTGIMGPDGGTPETPVGTVWVAVGNKEKVRTQLFKFRFDRATNIQLTSVNALNLLRLFVLED